MRGTSTKPPGYTPALLREVAQRSVSLVDMLHQLGQPLGSGLLGYLRRRLAHYGIDTSHFHEEPLPARPKQRYTKEVLEETAACSHSIREIVDYLGVPPYASAYGHIRRKLDRFGIDITHFRDRDQFRTRTIGEAELRAAALRSQSLAELSRHLDIPDNGTSRRKLKSLLARYDVPIDHFAGQSHNRGRPSPHRKTTDDILRRLETGSSRTGRALLHRALQEKGVPYVCGKCGTGELWQGHRLVLEIDHINGDRIDNRLHNLRYLCPSCHSQTRTFAGRDRSATNWSHARREAR